MGRAEKKRESFVWFKCKGSGQEAALKQIKGMKKSITRNNRSAELFSRFEYRERTIAQLVAAQLNLYNLWRSQLICYDLDFKRV